MRKTMPLRQTMRTTAPSIRLSRLRYGGQAMVPGLLCLLAVLLVLRPHPAQAVLKVDITGGYAQPMPIAVPAFPARVEQVTAAGSTSQIGAQIAQIIAADLGRSGLFRPIDPRAYTTTVNLAAVQAPDFASWRTVNAQALATGAVGVNAEGALTLSCHLYDVFGEEALERQDIRIMPQFWRRAAHKCADFIYQRLTGEDGYFDSRIVYIAESGPKTRRVKRLAIMDQDGFNHRFLTAGQFLVLTPRFSPSQQQITYMSYVNNQPRVYLMDLNSGKQARLGEFNGMTFAPRFSPDGQSVVMSLAQGGNSDIYTMDLRTRAVKRLTSHPGIDTSPSYAPDGSRIVFNSDRGGSQQLYTMNADGSNVQRISFGDARYGTPVWSPRGDLIAFTRIGGGKFRIGVMRPDGGGERLLTDAWQDEGPTWSPNGRVILFFRTERYGAGGSGGGSSLWSIDLTGLNERRLATPTDGSDPAWSPPLPWAQF